MAIRLQIRNGLASEWQQHNPLLMEGELAIEKDTRKFKIGDGKLSWNDLPYAEQGETGLQGPIGKSIQYIWSGTQLGIRVEGESTYQYVDLIGPKGDKGDKGDQGIQGIQGPKGDTGNGLEFNWDGTQLGIRVAGTTTYQYVDLIGPQGIQGPKGDKGDTGPQGEQGIQGPKGDKGDTGSIDNLEGFHISDALGYEPAGNKVIVDKFTDADGQLLYNGEEIGGAVPNLTLNELTLGSRYKIVYNDIEDSLDLVVIE